MAAVWSPGFLGLKFCKYGSHCKWQHNCRIFTEPLRLVWSSFSPDTLFKAGSATEQDAQDIAWLGLDSEKEEPTIYFFFIMFIWNIFYFIACCPFSGHWEKPCLSLFLPIKSLCTLPRCPLGFLFDQDRSAALSASPPWPIPAHPAQVCTGSSRCGLSSAEQGQGEGCPPLSCSSWASPASWWHFG